MFELSKTIYKKVTNDKLVITAINIFCVLILLMTCSVKVLGQATYMVNGKPVSEQVYKAANLMESGLDSMRVNNNEVAVQQLSQAVQLAPDFAQAHHNLGLALAKVGKYPEAVDQLKMSMQLDPSIQATWYTLGGLYQSMGQIDDAIKIDREFLKRYPDSPEAPKIASIVQALSRESRRHPNGQYDVNSGDYFNEVTGGRPIRWPPYRMPLKVFIYDGQNVPGWEPSYTQVLVKSFQDWAAASAGRLGFVFVNDPSQADIICSWTNDINRFSSSAEAGETKLTNDQNGIMRASIQILTVPLSTQLQLTPNKMRVICLHEIGHVLGLAGHTTNPQDIMFYSATISDAWRDLSSRDSATIRHLYSYY